MTRDNFDSAIRFRTSLPYIIVNGHAQSRIDNPASKHLAGQNSTFAKSCSPPDNIVVKLELPGKVGFLLINYLSFWYTLPSHHPLPTTFFLLNPQPCATGSYMINCFILKWQQPLCRDPVLVRGPPPPHRPTFKTGIESVSCPVEAVSPDLPYLVQGRSRPSDSNVTKDIQAELSLSHRNKSGGTNPLVVTQPTISMQSHSQKPPTHAQ
ncbi:hypothetical protein BDD12DRAFT_804626 [Trichophaea hybrida]|nr:hypothetical protein BDD12DRAFT_804626 [Trichophaea hybrida]